MARWFYFMAMATVRCSAAISDGGGFLVSATERENATLIARDGNSFNLADLSSITKLAAIGDSYLAGIGAGQKLGSTLQFLDPDSSKVNLMISLYCCYWPLWRLRLQSLWSLISLSSKLRWAIRRFIKTQVSIQVMLRCYNRWCFKKTNSCTRFKSTSNLIISKDVSPYLLYQLILILFLRRQRHWAYKHLESVYFSMGCAQTHPSHSGEDYSGGGQSLRFSEVLGFQYI